LGSNPRIAFLSTIPFKKSLIMPNINVFVYLQKKIIWNLYFKVYFYILTKIIVLSYKKTKISKIIYNCIQNVVIPLEYMF
jgi:hypothetical protein